ncbi:DMT family transporter [Aurantimonas sp. Leaf443]|uniref:DMT family transporter n=1 Tax=Aurantimonas sp. Leaf443 TaxID=1736378 RepID=UPI000B257CEB|nr:DMT family transporter [Aurantimonas sp. Leaf443]
MTLTDDSAAGAERPPVGARAAVGGGLAVAALLVGAAAMGLSPVFVRNAEVGPFASAFWRVFGALPLLALWAVWEGRHGAASPSEPPAGPKARLRAPVLLAGLFFSGDLLFWHLAIRDTSIANATFLACLAPFWVALLSRVTIAESVAPTTLLGLLVCLPGAALLVFHSGSLGQGAMGDFYGLLTSFFFGLFFLAVREARRTMGAGAITFRSTAITSAVLLVAALLAGERLLPPGASGAANLAALATVSHAGGQGLLAFALGALSASFSSLVIFAEAVAAALFAYLFAGESLSLAQGAGGLLILAGIFVARPRAPVVPPAVAASEVRGR